MPLYFDFMLTTLVGVIGALAGTIVGSVIAQYLHRRNAAHARVHESRIEAYRTFAAAVMDFRSALMDRWFAEHEGKPNPDVGQVYVTRDAAWSALCQVTLLAGDPETIACAERALELTSTLKSVDTRDALNDRGHECREAIKRFVESARVEVTAVPLRQVKSA